MKSLPTFLIFLFLSTSLVSQIQEYHIQNFDLAPEDNFGFSVAISEKFLAVGTRNQSNGLGTIFIYESIGDEWLLRDTLYNPLETIDYNGSSLAMTNRYLVSGAPGDYLFEDLKGKACVYELIDNKWEQAAVLQPNDDYLQSGFGGIVNIHNESILVAAPEYGVFQNLEERRGSVVLFEKVGGEWIQTQEFLNPETTIDYQLYANSIDMNDDWIAITAFQDTLINNEYPSRMLTYLYQKIDGNWIEKQVIKSDFTVSPIFQRTLALELSEDQLFISNFRHPEIEIEDGELRVYNLEDDVWVEKQKILPDGFDISGVGRHVAFHDKYAITGASHYPPSSVNMPHHNLIYDTTDKDNWRLVADFAYGGSYFLDVWGFNYDINNFFAAASTHHDPNRHGDVYIYDLRRMVNNQNILTDVEIDIFPNPTSDMLNIESTKAMKQIMIFNPHGQILQDNKFNSNTQQLDIEDLSPGTYWLKLSTDEGHMYKKFVKI